jgi:hypothetical protein
MYSPQTVCLYLTPFYFLLQFEIYILFAFPVQKAVQQTLKELAAAMREYGVGETGDGEPETEDRIVFEKGLDGPLEAPTQISQVSKFFLFFHLSLLYSTPLSHSPPK